jgi:hypothetical protein
MFGYSEPERPPPLLLRRSLSSSAHNPCKVRLLNYQIYALTPIRLIPSLKLKLRQLILIELDLLSNFNIASLNLLLFPRQRNL